MFERHRGLIPDYDGFIDALRTRPTTWLRASRRCPGGGRELAARLAGAGFPAEALAWCPDAVRVERLARPGASLEWYLGLYHIQGLTSQLPPLALGAGPGDRVVDLCAAPGSKASQLCDLVGDGGFVIANEPYKDRLSILKMHVERLGHANACLTRVWGDAFPGGLEVDRVLLDGPCSGEGTERIIEGESAEDAEARVRNDRRTRALDMDRLYGLQRKLIRRAANLLRPGGVMVYSTCTYAPEENEVALDDVLRERSDLVLEPLPAPLDDVLGGEPGLTAWQGRALDPALGHARRFYPHRAGNSWGFFVARLRRTDAARRLPAPTVPLDPPPEADGDHALALEALAPYDLDPRALADLRIVRFGRAFWLAARALPHPSRLARWRPQNPGLRLLRDDGRMGKPTTYAAIRLDGAIRARRVRLADDEVPGFLAGRPLVPAAAPPDAAALPDGAALRGYVAAEAGGRVLGLGLWKGGALEGQVPERLREVVRGSFWVAPGARFDGAAPSLDLADRG